MRDYKLYIISGLKSKSGYYIIKGYVEQVDNPYYKYLCEIYKKEDEMENEELKEIIDKWDDRALDIPEIKIRGVVNNYKFIYCI